MQTRIEGNVATTTDLYFAAFLLARGCALASTAKAEGRTVFEIKAPESVILDGIHLEYLNDQATVRALTYAQAIKTLKSVVHS